MGSPTARARMRWLYAPWAIAAVVLFAYFLLWRVGVSQLTRAVNDWAEDQRDAGVEVTFDALKSDGFPFFLRVHIEQPEIVYTDQLSWRTDRVTIDALPYDLTRLIFSARSDQLFRLSDGSEWRFGASDFRVSVANDKYSHWKLAATIADANAHRSDGSTVTLRRLVMDVSPTAADTTIIAANLAADGLRVKAHNSEFGLDTIQTSLAASQTPLLGHLHRWRDAGGALLINGFIATLDNASFSLSGELVPDHQLFPTGSLLAEVKSPATFVHLLTQAGVLNDSERERVSSTLTLAAIAGGGRLVAPVLLEGGGVQLAGVTIAKLDPNN